MTVGPPLELSSKPRALSHPGQLDLCLDLNSGEKHGSPGFEIDQVQGRAGRSFHQRGGRKPRPGAVGWRSGVSWSQQGPGSNPHHDMNNEHAGVVSGLLFSVSQTEAARQQVKFKHNYM